ncbi:ribonuclease III [Patescibacteria group bacterium]|nr:ribonuclease III [Patescibacteria group bacterium]
MPEDPKQLEKIIKIKFKNPDLLQTAMTHRSYLNEHPHWKYDHNERLEFLGDAVLELSVTDYLFNTYDDPEGELTNWRAALVRGVTLKEVADDLRLGKYLYLSRGEELSGGRQRELILANTVESLIGAVYLDQGYTLANQFILKNIVSKLPKIFEDKLYLDAKSHLQERSQEKFGQTPTYELVSASGPDHAKQFVMAVKIGDNKYGEGSGNSKQEAEQNAAQAALEKWEKNNE